MPDDFVFNVRQIAQYPFTDTTNSTDAFVLQRNGVGGRFMSTTVSGMMTALQDSSDILAIGVTPPWNSTGAQIFTQSLTLGVNGALLYNLFDSGTGTRYWQGGPGGVMQLSTDGMSYCFAPSGTPGALATPQEVFWVDGSGNMSVTGTITALDPTVASNVATMGWVTSQMQGLVVVSGTAPSNPYAGMIWFDSTDKQTFIYTGSEWTISVNPPAGAPLASPAFTGTPTVNGAVIASTPDITNAINALRPTIVTSFNGRTNGITLTPADVTATGAAMLNSPSLTGNPTAPTQVAGNNTTSLATTAFVSNADAVLRAWVNAQNFAPRTNPNFTGTVTISGNNVATQGWVNNQFASLNLTQYAPRVSPAFTGTPTISGASIATQNWVQVQLNGLNITSRAPLASPNFTGTPTAPTAPEDTNTTQISTTAFVQRAFDTLNGMTVIRLAQKANIASPTFTGEPRAPTPHHEDHSTRLATTEFTADAIERFKDWLDPDDFAHINSPHFTGMPTAPTPEAHSSDGKIATTAFVMGEIEHHTAGVTAFNHRTGHVELRNEDIEGLNTWARLHSPNFTGDPHAPTAHTADHSTRIATTEFVKEALDLDAVRSFNERRGHVTLTLQDIEVAGGARFNSPIFSGAPQAPTPHRDDESNRIATTSFVNQFVEKKQEFWNEKFDCIENELAKMHANTVWTFNQRKGNVILSENDISAAGGAPIHSPIFTGEPRAPNPQFEDKSTRVATTHFVMDAIKAIPSGPPGLTGPRGERGDPGPVMQLSGSVQQFYELPPSADPGEIWEVRETGTLYSRTAYGWDAIVWHDSPHDGGVYGRRNGSWSTIGGPYLPLAGGVMTPFTTPGQTGIGMSQNQNGTALNISATAANLNAIQINTSVGNTFLIGLRVNNSAPGTNCSSIHLGGTSTTSPHIRAHNSDNTTVNFEMNRAGQIRWVNNTNNSVNITGGVGVFAGSSSQCFRLHSTLTDVWPMYFIKTNAGDASALQITTSIGANICSLSRVLNQIPAPTTRFTDANSVVEARSFNYSTDEINTGAKWIDGKPIFRRVVHCINWLAHADLNQILNVMDTPIKALGVKHDPASTWNRVTIENIVITTSGEPSARDLSPPFHAIIEYTKL